MRTRSAVILFSIMLLLIPMLALADSSSEQVRIGTNSQIYVHLNDMDTQTLELNGIPYQPVITASNMAVVKTADLITALQIDAAKDQLQQQGIDVADLYIRSGKVFLSAKDTEDGSASEHTRQLANVRAILDGVNVSAHDLTDKSFTIGSGMGTANTFAISSVWQSPIDPPGYDPDSRPAPVLPPASRTIDPTLLR